MKGGDTYVLTVWWHTPSASAVKNKHGVRQDVGFDISRDGREITALRMIKTELVPVRGKLPGKRETFHVPQREWHLARDYEQWAKSQGQDPQLFLADLFLGAIQKQQGAQQSLVRVTVEKDKMRAVFSVNPERLSYFFQDRDIQLTENGRRKPIFHIVKAHPRADGTLRPIHSAASVPLPGPATRPADHRARVRSLDPNQFTLGGTDEYWLDHPEDMMEHKELGAVFAADVSPARP